MVNKYLSTGQPGLDRIIGGVLAGDNIVFQLEAIGDFFPFVTPFYQQALSHGQSLIYFRFANHRPLVPKESGAWIVRLNPEEGFEAFLNQVHDVIEQSGRGAYYVFDCLSDLLVDWYSDQMLANFFMLTCPYLYDLETVTFFPLRNNAHSSYATSPITETTQLFLSIYRRGDKVYLRPVKVLHRYSSTMYMLHVQEGDEFLPVSESTVISEILSSVPRPQLHSGGAHLDIWNRTFAEAERVYSEQKLKGGNEEDVLTYFNRLLRMAISRDKRMLQVCERQLTIADLLDIGDRIIGTGLIGGKSVGMLLARAILRNTHQKWNVHLEKHDSFFIASDVFYTYLVRNGCWWGRESLQNPERFLKGASEVRRQILRGTFPDYLLKQFADMLHHFGQSPIVVRSSSLLEDSFGHSFAGKYESVFCANQGPESQRMEDFLSAIRTIYASTMSEAALRYRAQRGLLKQDEQMALLVQRVSGSMYGSLFYPQLAGVGFSYNPYAWDSTIDPQAGVLRLVFGLGTRAVERSDDDYTRLLALNAPERRPGEGATTPGLFAQRNVDVLDLGANLLVTHQFEKVAEHSAGLNLDMFASVDPVAERFYRERGQRGAFNRVITFDGVIGRSKFVTDMREMLKTLSDAYQYPVDVEFTANMVSDEFRINLVQCRPFQIREGSPITDLDITIDEQDVILETHGVMIGRSRICSVDRLIYVPSSTYEKLPHQKRYTLARLIGDLVRLEMPGKNDTIMLIGPGRWGTTAPQLGVPVSFSDISRVSILCEIVAMRDGLVPDVSLGTHFFNDLVEMDMLYLALFPEQADNFVNQTYFDRLENRLPHFIDNLDRELLEAVVVIEPNEMAKKRPITLHANTIKQHAICYLSDLDKSGQVSRD